MKRIRNWRKKTGRKVQESTLWDAMEKMMHLEDNLEKSSKTLYLKQARDESTKNMWLQKDW